MKTVNSLDCVEWCGFAGRTRRKYKQARRDEDHTEAADLRKAAMYAYLRASGEGGNTAREFCRVSPEGEALILQWLHLYKLGKW